MIARACLFVLALSCVAGDGAAQTVSAPGACTATRRTPCPSAADLILAANNAARQRAGASAYNGARQIYAYAPGALYELHASENFVSSILLEPGEAVTAIAAGDTARWMVTEAEAEAAVAPRAVILVKPLAAALRTNIVIITDRRTYTIEARSSAGDAYAAEIAWSYPLSAPVSAAPSAAPGSARYRIRTVRGAPPAWAPDRVFDDGARTYVEFGSGVAVREMAPIFIITPEGAELANYRVDGQRMVIDRLFDRAELRMGVRAPVVVRIEREGAPPVRTRARRGVRP